MPKKDYYQVLGVSKSANSGDIKKAYLKLAKKFHPDQNKDDKDAEQKFKEISEAYDILKDEQKRAAYDRFGHEAYAQGAGRGNQSHGGFGNGFGGGNADFQDIFGDFFSDFMGGGNHRRPRTSQVRGSDLTTKLTISLEEAFSGVRKELRYSTQTSCSTCQGKGTQDQDAMTNCSQCGGSGAIRMQQGIFAVEQTCNKCHGAGQIIKNPCSNCNGNGRKQSDKKLMINVPAGVEDGLRIRHTGEGEAGLRGGSNGDLYVFINIKPHEIFQVNGNDLHFKLPLTITKAALGGSVKVPTIEGGKIELKIPSGTQTGDKLRVKNKGMSQIRSTSRGDMYAHAFVETPTKLTKKQTELLEQLDKEIGDGTASYCDPGFFSKMKNIWS